ncbi:MAG: hypothetical protein ACI857_000145 [Arenicella sp.]|jgi:hypothetical protein
MKKWLGENKFHLLSIAAIFILFIASILVRDKELNTDISAEQEWITAHILITNQVWEEGGGPSKFKFSPVYTYKGAGNKKISAFGGVMDENGNQYYVSYPPFAFLFAYYSTKILGGSDVFNLRAVSLILHFFCCFLLYLVFKNLHHKQGDFVCIAGFVAVTLYLFSAGTLWMHSILYFSDMLVQIFVIWTLYLVIKLYKSETKNPKSLLISLAAITFLACYTEWLALFIAFILGIVFLIWYFKKKEKKFLHAFLLVGLTAALALFTTITQYSSIAGFQSFKEVSTNKYDQRSGHGDQKISAAGFNLENPDSFELLNDNITRNFWMVENLLPIVAILFVLFILWRKTRQKIKDTHLKVALLAVLTLSIFLHYSLFFNFNALHNFSNLKTGFLFIFIIGLMLLIIEEAITLKWKIALSMGIFLLIGLKLPVEIGRFHSFCEGEPYAIHYSESADYMRDYCPEDTYAFTNLPYTQAEYIYRAQHLPFRVQDTSAIHFYMNYFDTDVAQYYHHENLELTYVLDLKRVDEKFVVVKRQDRY